VGSLDKLVDIQKQRQKAPVADRVDKKLNLSPVRSKNCEDDECGKRISPVKRSASPSPPTVVKSPSPPIIESKSPSPIQLDEEPQSLIVEDNQPEVFNQEEGRQPDQITITIEQFHPSNRESLPSPLAFSLTLPSNNIPIILHTPILIPSTSSFIINISDVGESVVDTSVLDYLSSIYGWYCV
jgi:hypothetical protein